MSEPKEPERSAPEAGAPQPGAPQPEDTYAPRAVLAGLVVIVLLVAGAFWLVHTLRDSSNLQDCVMQGRSNCAPVDSSSGN